MGDYQYTELKIDKTFKNLIPPLSADEYKQLEENLINEGCRDPICAWNGIIIDGHNRYEICLKHEIPFQIKRMNLKNKTEAIAWICANQIGRRNISEATRRYLIGKRYESEKVLGIANFEGKNQHSQDKEDVPNMLAHPTVQSNVRRTSKIIGDEYHLSHATVEKYGAYSRAIDTLSKKNEELTPKILSGQTKISHENVIELSKLPVQEVKRLSKKLIENDRSFVGYCGAYDDNGKAKTKNVLAKTKTECLEKLEVLKEQCGRSTDKLKADMPFGDWMDYWYQTYSKPTLRL